jgi:hypothetical protein
MLNSGSDEQVSKAPVSSTASGPALKKTCDRCPIFLLRVSDSFLTTFTTQFTTSSPQKTTSVTRFFQNTPQKAKKTAKTCSRTALQFFREKATGLGLQDGLEEHTGTNDP